MVGRLVRILRSGLLARIVVSSSVIPLVTTFVVPLSAQTIAVNPTDVVVPGMPPITIDIAHVPLTTAIQQISTQAGLTPVYSAALAKNPTLVTLQLRHVPVTQAFALALRGTGFRAVIGTGMVSFGEASASLFMTNGSITGKVVDARTRRPLRGVTFVVDGKGTKSVSSDDGTFHIANVAPGSHVVHIRLLGYTKVTKSVTVIDGQVFSLEIVLEPSASALDEVVVTGTVAATELRAVSNAVTVITGKELEQRGITHIDQLFHGDVPGIWVQDNGTQNLQPGQVAQVMSRGSNTLGGVTGQITKAMKTYVDGVELADPTYLGLIDPRSIERIEILSGPQASTIYGSGAIMGVLQVFTKRGTTTRPQVTGSLMSGTIQNSFTTALTPQHDYSAQLSQVEGRIAYNVGGSWTHTGPWSPAVHSTTAGGFGGARMQAGPMTADVSLRRTLGTNWQQGSAQQTLVAFQYDGFGKPASSGYPDPETYTSSAQTWGTTLTYTPTSWWSHTATVGTDVTNAQTARTGAMFSTPTDTLLSISQSNASKTNLAYTTTIHVPVTSVANATITGGADGYNSLTTSLNGSPSVLTGSRLSSTNFSVSRTAAHARGLFLQGQLGVWDAVYFTYGMRADFNPNYGENADPNVVPRYGIAITRDLNTPFGPVTAKVRASYGHSTRPPSAGIAQDQYICVSSPSACAMYTSYWGGGIRSVIANPELRPEQQQGGEGGLELYFGNRASIIVTRYNQTVDNLIFHAPAYDDSVRSLLPASEYNPSNYTPAPDGYVYYLPAMYINVGDIRNQGWELQGSMNVGPITMKGTYSFTKSRVIGVTPRYQSALGWSPGVSFGGFPEHTYAFNLQYAHQGTTIGLDVQGQGASWTTTSWNIGASPLTQAYQCVRYSRLVAYQCGFGATDRTLKFAGPGYLGGGDLNVSQRLSPHLDGVLQVFNLRDSYQFDGNPNYATIGRQAKFGVRIRY